MIWQTPACFNSANPNTRSDIFIGQPLQLLLFLNNIPFLSDPENAVTNGKLNAQLQWSAQFVEWKIDYWRCVTRANCSRNKRLTCFNYVKFRIVLDISFVLCIPVNFTIVLLTTMTLAVGLVIVSCLDHSIHKYRGCVFKRQFVM